MPDQSQADQLSPEDLGALHETWRHLQDAGDPRAEKLRSYIKTTGESMLHPDQDSSWLSKGWNWLNKGFISKDTLVRAMSGRTSEQLNKDLEPYSSESPTHAAIREFVRGTTQDTAGTASGFTSPLAIGTIGTGAATKIPGAVGTVAKAVTGTASAGFGAKGAADIIKAGTENTPEAWQQRLQGGAMVAGSAAGAIESGLPTAAAKTGQVVKAGAQKIGTSVGVIDPEPTSLMTRAVKPRNSNTGWNDAIQSAMPNLKAAEQALGKPVQSIEDALQATNIAKKNIWNQYAQKLQQAQKFTQNAPSLGQIDGNAIADEMVNSIDPRMALKNPGLAQSVKKFADSYRRPINLQEAEDFLQSANNELHSYYAKNKVGRRVAQGDPEVASTVAEADAIRDNLYKTLDNLTGPGAADIKKQYGALSNVEEEMLSRKNVAARQQPVSLAEQMSMARGYGKIAKGVVTMSPGDIAEGLESTAMSKWLKERNTSDAMIERAFKAWP